MNSKTFKTTICAAAAALLVAAPAADAAPKAKAKALVLDAPAAVDAGAPAAVTVTAVGKKGKAVRRFGGKVTFASTDPAAKLPATYKFSKADKGRHTFEVTLSGSGSHTLTASSKVKRKRITGSRAVTVSTGGSNPGGDPGNPGNPGEPTLASIHLSVPSSVVAGESFAPTVVGKDASGNSLGDQSSKATFTIGGEPCDPSGCVTTTAGNVRIDAVVGQLGDSATVAVKPAAAESLTISGPGAVNAGQSIAPDVAATDRFGNRVAAGATLAISPDGSCSATACSATKSGPHTITASSGPLSRSLNVTVDPGPLSELRVNAPNSATAGSIFGVSANGFDQYGNSRGNVTTTTAFTAAGGSCENNGCYSRTAGTQRVEGTLDGVTGTGQIEITPAALNSLRVTPASNGSIAPSAPTTGTAAFSRIANATMAYSVTGLDVYGNSRGDVTSQATVSLDDKTCPGAVCSGNVFEGNRTVVARIGNFTGTTPVTVLKYDDAYRIDSCVGENYDINGKIDDGCEIDNPKAGRGTEATAIDLGSKSCSDSSSRTSMSGRLLHDAHAHTGDIPGFETITGSAGTVYKIRATGGACVNDLDLKFQTFFGVDDGSTCYEVSVRTDRNFDRAWTDGSGTTGIVRESGYYSDNSDIYVAVKWTCSRTEPAKAVNYSIDLRL